MDSEKKGPISKSKMGRFQVSLWKRDKFVAARHECDAERSFVSRRACVQYSRWNRYKHGWENQSIWFGWDELRDLAQALEGLDPLPLVEGKVVLAR